MSDPIVLSEGKERRHLSVTSASTRMIRVTSHYPFHRVNARLQFDRARAEGFRLDIPAGTSLAWTPGERKDVTLVAYGGRGGA